MMLGDTTTGTVTTTTVTPSYMTGLQSWFSSPSTAFQALGATLTSPSTSFSGASLAPVLGLWTPPLLAGILVLSMMGGKGRR